MQRTITSGKRRWRSAIVNVLGVLAASLIVTVGGAAPAQAAEGNILPPFNIGETWNICRGYGYASHTGTSNYGIDLTGAGCDNSASGRTVRAPMNGTVYYYQASYGNLCVNAAGGRSYTLTHIDSSVTSGTVTAGQAVGTVAAPGQRGNNGVAHIHFQLWSTPNCYSSSGIPFDSAHGARICGAPDLTASGPNGGNGTWSGTSFVGQVCGGSGTPTKIVNTDYNRDGTPDIYAIQRNDVSSNSTAVRIINGTNVYQWLLQSGTLLSQTGPETSFAVADYNQDGTPDIYAFNRNDTGSGRTAVRIINGANLHQWLLQSPTILGVTSDSTEFAVGFYNGDSTPDIYAIQRNDAGSNSTAVRIINGANVYQWLLQTGTILGQTSSAWDFRVADFNKDGKSDLYAFNRHDTGSNSTSVHIINGVGFSSWLLQSGTLLSPTTAQWSFS